MQQLETLKSMSEYQLRGLFRSILQIPNHWVQGGKGPGSARFAYSLFCLLLFCAAYTAPAQSQKKVLLILLDGIPAEVLERVNTPSLDQIAEQGGYSRGIMGGEIGGKSESPTISAVGYTTMLTGTWANKHRVYDNAINNPNYKYWTIYSMLRHASPDAKLGIFSTWEDNRTKILGAGLKATGYLNLDFVADGYEKDTIRFPHDQKKLYLNQIDQLVTDLAARTILEEGPDLSWVYLEYTDAVGHQFGDSAEMDHAVQLADQRVGQLYSAIQARMDDFAEEWLVLVTTDHGRTATDGKDHGGQSEREREIWFVTNAKNLSNRFRSGKVEMVDVVPTLVDFLEIQVPRRQRKNWDGSSLVLKR
ncbi:alkaline phosphatase family protein [Algoriphagus namhaensis]